MINILNVENLNFSYGKDRILENINLKINEGEFVALVGENGAGKSTLIKLILGELKPESGEIKLNLSNGYRELSYVPQLGFGSSYNFPITCYELVSFGISSRGIFKNKSIVNERVLNALSQVGMKGFEKSLYYKLSGGQRQRVLIAKALVSNPKLLLLDEPSSGIDIEGRTSLYSLLAHLNKNHGITIFMITHDSNVRNFTNDFYELKDKHLSKIRGRE